MDGLRFDDLTRSVATTSRRGALRLLAAGALGGLATLLDRDGAAACRRIRRACTRHGQCCSGRCDPQRRRCQGSCPNGQKPCNGGCIVKSATCGAVPNPTVVPLAPAPSGLIPCSGVQIDPRTDEANCGACGRGCPAGGRCVDGECFCPAGTSRCPGTDRCVDLRTELANCGACGRSCLPGQTCTDGRCQAAICAGATDFDICFEDPAPPTATVCSGAPNCVCARGADGGTACVDSASFADFFNFVPCTTNADCFCPCDPRPGACVECEGTRLCASYCTPM